MIHQGIITGKLRENIHYLYIFSLLVLVTGIPVAKFLVSVAQFMLAGTWLIDGILNRDFREKINNFFHSVPALLLVSLFVLHLLGLLYTTDFNYALKDLRTKLPLLILPFVIFSLRSPGPKEKKFIYILFVLSVLTGTFISTSLYFTTDFLDVREVVKPINSHIRFSLCVAISVIILINFLRSGVKQPYLKIISLITIGWFIAFLVLIESIAVLLLLLTLLLLWMVLLSFRFAKPVLKSLFLIIIISVVLALYFYINKTVVEYRTPDYSSLRQLAPVTAGGRPYIHDTLMPVENGNYIGIYICEPELSESWNQRSKLDYHGVDNKGQELRQTLIRYLNSCGYTKDSTGVSNLSPKDISHVENGYANVEYTRPFSLKSRIYKILWEIDMAKKSGSPEGHSVLQRIEYIKTSIKIIGKHFWTGVGTGDMNLAFEEEYDNSRSPLGKEFRLRSHNQYLSFWIGFGFFGFLWFLFVLVFPVFRWNKFKDYLFINIYIILLASMLFEDTLETQSGVTLFAFFYSVLFLETGILKGRAVIETDKSSD